MFELELELLDKQIGDLEVERVAGMRMHDDRKVAVIDEKLERLWAEVRRLSELEARVDLADAEERTRILGRAN